MTIILTAPTVPMVPLSAFYPYLAPRVHGASEPAMDQALVSAATRWCRESNCVQRIQTASTVIGEPEYALTPPSDMQLGRVLTAWYRTTKLELVAPDYVDSPFAFRPGLNSSETAAVGDPRGLYQKSPDSGSVLVWPVPDTAVTDSLTIRAAFFPAQDATTLPQMLLDQYAVDLARGAASILHRIPGQTFSNPTLALEDETLFLSGLRGATMQAMTGNQRPALAVRPRPWM